MKYKYTYNYKFQQYPTDVTKLTPLGLISLVDFIRLHINDENKQLFTSIAKAEKDGNNTLKAELKQNSLTVFTPCVIIGENQNNGYKTNQPNKIWKDYAHIESFTGLAVLDFDHLIKYGIDAVELKEALFQEYRCIIACWVSPSKNGVKALVSIPIVNTVDEFQEYYAALEEEFGSIAGFDGSAKNPTLSLFQSFDPDFLTAGEHTIWTKKLPKPPPKPVVIFDHTPTTREKEIVVKNIVTMFNKVTSDNGHNPLRSLARTVGGYVANGYLTESEAIEMLDYGIDHHYYLSQKTATYKKTARWAVGEGQLTPLAL